MTPPEDDLERQLSDALAARARGVEPAHEHDSLGRIEQRIDAERKARTTRRGVFIGLAVAAALIVIVGAVVLLRDDGTQSVTVVPAASPSSSSAVPSTSNATTSTTAPRASFFYASPHVWPLESSSTTFATPQDAARSFAVDYLGMTNARVGEATTVDSPPGLPAMTVDVFPNARSTARTAVSVVQSGPTGWVVIGANADEIVVDDPRPGGAIESPLSVSGRGTAFEGQLGLEVRSVGSANVVATGTAMTGSNGEIGPFSTTIDPPATDQPLVLIVFEADASGGGTYTKATVMLLGT